MKLLGLKISDFRKYFLQYPHILTVYDVHLVLVSLLHLFLLALNDVFISLTERF